MAKISTIGVLTSGGDAPGMNAAIRAVTRAAIYNGWKVKGIYRGWEGLINNEIKDFTSESVSGTINRGGTILRTARSKDFMNEEGRARAYENIKAHGIDALIVIGGNGSLAGAQVIASEYDIPCVGLPGTIDNDLYGTDTTIGYDTALNTIMECVDKIRDTANSHNRIFFVEVMGRDAGWIALNAAVAGGAEVCLLPEFPYDIEIVKEKLESRFVHDRGFAVVVISEGAKPKDGQQVFEVSKEVGYENVKLGGIGQKFIEQMKAAGFKHDMRETTLGHLQRGGVPIAYDRVLASQFGVKAFEMVLNQEYGNMVAYRHPNIISVPLKDAVAKMNLVTKDHDLVRTAMGLGISLGI